MNIVDRNTAKFMSISNFVGTVYATDNKPVLFWDTCSLLEIIRFVFHNPDDSTIVYGQIKNIIDKIVADDIYSIASEINIDELNDNHTKAINFLVDSLQKTTNYHKNAIKTANALNGTALISESLVDKHIDTSLNQLLMSVISKTYFLELEEKHSHNALLRVRSNTPPAGKKEEFKDCAIWETALGVFREVAQIRTDLNNVFYTVNIDDFCSVNKNTNNVQFLFNLITEATTFNFNCCKSISEVSQYI